MKNSLLNKNSKFFKNKKSLITLTALAATPHILPSSASADTLSVVNVNVDGEVQRVVTRANTVQELFDEIDVNISTEDDLNTDLSSPIENNMEVELTSAKRVVLTFNGDKLERYTTAETVEDFLLEENISVTNEDILIPSQDMRIEENMKINFTASMRVTVVIGGEAREALTTERSVVDFLHDQNIVLGENDIVEPALSEALSEGGTVVVTKVDKRVEVEEKEIPYVTINQNDPDLNLGETRVITAGKSGRLVQNIERTWENDELVNEVLVSEETSEEVVNEVIAVGTKSEVLVNASGDVSNDTISSNSKVNISRLISYSKNFLSVPYVYGGTTPAGFDCSGFVQYVFKNSTGKSLPRTAAQMAQVGKATANPVPGDLVFFKEGRAISHVGIYLGGDLFISATSSKGVKIDSLSSGYWGSRYVGAKSV